MSVVVTRENADGTFDEVGMNNRRLLPLKTERGVINRLHKMKWTSRTETRKFRLEWFKGGEILREPISTTFVVILAEWPDVAELGGTDKWFIRNRLGRIHVSSSLLEAAREARPKKMRKVPREVRRAWALCVIDTWNANVNLYIGVVRPGMQKAKTNIWGRV